MGTRELDKAMRTVVLYPYDSELRPGLLGADFTSDNPNVEFTLRIEADEADVLMKYTREFLRLDGGKQ
jgi:hypothetical protein